MRYQVVGNCDEIVKWLEGFKGRASMSVDTVQRDDSDHGLHYSQAAFVYLVDEEMALLFKLRFYDNIALHLR